MTLLPLLLLLLAILVGSSNSCFTKPAPPPPAPPPEAEPIKMQAKMAKMMKPMMKQMAPMISQMMKTMTPSASGQGNFAKFLKNLNAEQIVKLQAKNQHECELLEDIRSYTLKRSQIERSYSEALLKISSAYLNKKIPNIPDIKTDGGPEQWNMWNVWRTVLEENEKLARARLAAIEVFSQNVADDSKHLRAAKLAAQKKAIDTLTQVQKELQTTVADIDRHKKLYFDEEHSAHDVRDKARDIEEKLKRKKGSFFQSITSLQKNSAKVTSKRDQLEEKSTGARNDYLLSLAAANAHQRRYFLVDLQTAMQAMEASVYEKVSDYLTLISRTELLTCSATQNSFSRIRDQAQQLSRDYSLQCVYLYYPVLKQHIQYDFEPCDDDQVDKITAEHTSAAQTLSAEAKRWATKIGREHNSIRENNRKLQALIFARDSGQKTDPNDPNNTDIDAKIDELRTAIRKSETSKMKAEARIECLRLGGINVDEFMQELDTLSVQDIPRSGSSLSVRTDASGIGEPPSSDSCNYDSDNYDGPDTPKRGDDPADSDDERKRHDSEVDAMLEQERQKIEQLTAGWDDPTQVDWGGEDPAASSASQKNSEGVPSIVYKCVALYSYTAQNPDELNMVESEQLEVVGEGDGDGWVRARNYRGEEGFVPQNYLDVDRSLASTQGGSSYQLNTQISFSSVDYTVDEETDQGQGSDAWPGPAAESESEPWPAPAAESNSEPWPEASSAQSGAEPWPPTDNTQANDSQAWTADFQAVQSGPESNASLEQEFVDDGFHYCIALYDYEASAPEELTFVENQVIKLLKKNPHDVDDGWWEGSLDGQIGLFPALLVEECRPDGQPLTPEDDESPPPSAPPAHTPPEVPTFLIAPQTVLVTQPTPIDEHPTEGSIPNGSIKMKSDEGGDFEMSLTKGQHEQYKKQFDGVPDIPAITHEETDEEVEAATKSSSQRIHSKAPIPSLGSGLGVAEIVITAATPMHEEPETPFPPVPEEPEEEEEEEVEDKEAPERESIEEESISENLTTVVATKGGDSGDGFDDPTDDCPTDSAPFPISSSTGSEDEPSSGPSTAENSQSLPEELEPQALARLKNLKESNA